MQLFKQIKPEYTDARGDILKILDDGKTLIKSTLLITSNKGSIRANHYHKKDTHYCYMITGKMEYYEKPVGADKSMMQKVIVEAGDVIFTPSMHEHAMRFLEDSAFLTLSTESRPSKAYEEDLVRVKLIE